jgi:hypothetical protein
MTREINAIHREGVDSEGLLGGDLFTFSADKPQQAAGMQLIVKDANRVAAAGQFRVIDHPLNSGSAQARVIYNAPEFEGPTALLGDLDDFPRHQAPCGLSHRLHLLPPIGGKHCLSDFARADRHSARTRL